LALDQQQHKQVQFVEMDPTAPTLDEEPAHGTEELTKIINHSLIQEALLGKDKIRLTSQHQVTQIIEGQIPSAQTANGIPGAGKKLNIECVNKLS
jgi:hypothetical protein